MKKTLSLITLLILVFGCIKNDKPLLTKEYIPFITILNSNDSIDCWAIQFNEFFDTTTMESQSIDVLYCGLHYFTPDSIFSFSYEYTNYDSEPYTLHGKNLIIPCKPVYRVEINKDTMWIQGKSTGEIYYDSLEVITLDSYVKIKISTSQLMNPYLTNEDTTSWDSQNLFKDCINIWPHYESIIYGFYKKYEPF